MIRNFFVATALLIFCAPLARAQSTYTTSTCLQADVNAAINNTTPATGGSPQHTAINGDKIVISATGSPCSWSSGVLINGVGIDITGTGTPNNGGSTVGAGTANVTLNETGTSAFFTFENLAFGQTAKVELLNMSTTNTAGTLPGAVQFQGTCTTSGCAQIRADNLNFTSGQWGNATAAPIPVDGVFGVMDHNTMNEAAAPSAFMAMVSFSAWQGVGTQGYNSFASADTFGTSQTMFFENNNLGHVRILDNDVPPTNGAVGGARYVCRFNTITNMAGNGLCGAHGTAWGGPFRGQRQLEVYYNTLTGSSCDAIDGLNSGTGYFLSNSYSGSGCNFTTLLDIARLDGSPAPVAPWLQCNGSSVMDPLPFSSTSFCLDQPGSGAGLLYVAYTGVSSEVAYASAPSTQCTTAGQCPPSAALDPVYTAGEVTPNNAGIAVDNGGSRVLANRDYYGQVSDIAQTSPTSPFNGTTGTGYGTLANRPTTCTTGVGYWATDQGSWNNYNSQQGILYKCTSTNTWGTLYTPYTYPHPLDASTGAVSLSPTSEAYGSVNVGSSSSPVTFTLTNNSGASATSISPTTTGGNPGDFTVTNSGAGSCSAAGGTIAVSASCTFTVTFTPATAGSRSTTLSVSYSGGDSNSPQTSALSGTGVSTGTSGTHVSGNVQISGGVKIQ